MYPHTVMSDFGSRSELGRKEDHAANGDVAVIRRANEITSIKAYISVTRNGTVEPFVRPTPQSDPWRHDHARIVS